MRPQDRPARGPARAALISRITGASTAATTRATPGATWPTAYRRTSASAWDRTRAIPDPAFIVPLHSDGFRCVPDGKLRVYPHERRRRVVAAALTRGLPQKDAYRDGRCATPCRRRARSGRRLLRHAQRQALRLARRGARAGSCCATACRRSCASGAAYGGEPARAKGRAARRAPKRRRARREGPPDAGRHPDPGPAAAVFRGRTTACSLRRPPDTVGDALAQLAALYPGVSRPRRHRAGRGAASHQRLRGRGEHPRRSGPLDARSRWGEDRDPPGRQRRLRRVQLKVPTAPAWIAAVLADLDAFLLDHASCERKASASAMALSRTIRIGPSWSTRASRSRGRSWSTFRRSPSGSRRAASSWRRTARTSTCGRLARVFRRGSDLYFLDRLLTAAIVEASGCERFGLVAAGLPAAEGDLKDFYRELARAEVRHQHLYLGLRGSLLRPGGSGRPPRGDPRRRGSRDRGAAGSRGAVLRVDSSRDVDMSLLLLTVNVDCRLPPIISPRDQPQGRLQVPRAAGRARVAGGRRAAGPATRTSSSCRPTARDRVSSIFSARCLADPTETRSSSSS